MAEKDRIGSHSVRMSTEEIVGRGFASKVRGISETEVRSFLRRVAEEIERLGKREDDLLGKIEGLESDLVAKPKASKAELLEILGEQTTKVLSSAESAAEQMVQDAKSEAEKILSEAKAQAEEMTSSARAQSEEKISEAQARVKSLQESSSRDADTVIKEARTRGREIFQESVVVREQILKDLLRRRDLLLEQIEELRHGREELLESYKVVKGSFQKATDALQGVEAKASGELMSHPIDVDELLKAPVELPQILNSNEPINSTTTNEIESEDSSSLSVSDSSNPANVRSDKPSDSPQTSSTATLAITGKEDEEKRKGIKNYMKDALGVGVPAAELDHNITDQDVPESVKVIETPVVKTVPKEKPKEKASKDVGALFKSLKDSEEDSNAGVEDSSSLSVLASDDAAEVRSDESSPSAAKSAAKSPSSPKQPKKKESSKKDPVTLRDDALSSVTTAIVRKAKRQLQDEQNELLDALRTLKPKKQVSAENILPDFATQIKIWEEIIHPELEEVFQAGASQVGADKVAYDDDAIKDAVKWVVAPLRETIVRAVDEGDQSEAQARVGARYREWRSSELKNALYDALCAAYNHGVLMAASSSATLTWNVTKAGQCPDCDDNALEPTLAREAFPTGQVAPPAHAGCRCVLTIA